MNKRTDIQACQSVEKSRSSEKSRDREKDIATLGRNRGGFSHRAGTEKYLNNRGITIIELIVAVAIVGILATLAISRYRTFVLKTKIQEAVVMLNHIQEMTDAYYANHGLYPTQDGTYILIADKNLGESRLAGHSFYDNLFGKTEKRLKELGIDKPSGESRFWYYNRFWGWGTATKIVYAYPKTKWDFYGFSDEECDNTLENVTVAIDNDGQIYVWGVPGITNW